MNKSNMPNEFNLLFTKTIPNFTVLLIIFISMVLGKIFSPELTNLVFETADQLVSELILVFIAISLGAFINNFQIVLWASIASFAGTCLFARYELIAPLTIDYLLAVLIVVLGFSSIANLYRHYRELKI